LPTWGSTCGLFLNRRSGAERPSGKAAIVWIVERRYTKLALHRGLSMEAPADTPVHWTLGETSLFNAEGHGMAASKNPQQTTNRNLRLFGWALAGSLALSGNITGPSPTALWLQLAGAAVFAIGTVRPSALRPIHSALMYCLRPLTRLSSSFTKTNQDRRPPGPARRRGQIANTGA
jgi:hypothetical protein